MTKHPCDGSGFAFPSSHCAPPVGDKENGFDCADCVLKKYIKKEELK